MADVFQFSDHRSFLKKEILERKSSRHGLGLRHLSRVAGFRSPASLSMIVNGKRKMTSEAAQKLASALNLNGRRLKYFLALTELERASSAGKKAEISENLLQLRNASEENLIEAKQYRFLATWFYPAIYVMAGQAGFKADAGWIARRFRKAVSPAEVEQALRDMIDLGLLKKEGKTLVPAQGSLKTSDEVQDISAKRYHSRMIPLSLDALGVVPEKREINGMTFAVPLRALPELKEKIRKFRAEVDRFAEPYNDAEEVYQLNIQLFPLTETRPSSLGQEDKS